MFGVKTYCKFCFVKGWSIHWNFGWACFKCGFWFSEKAWLWSIELAFLYWSWYPGRNSWNSWWSPMVIDAFFAVYGVQWHLISTYCFLSGWIYNHLIWQSQLRGSNSRTVNLLHLPDMMKKMIKICFLLSIIYPAEIFFALVHQLLWHPNAAWVNPTTHLFTEGGGTTCGKSSGGGGFDLVDLSSPPRLDEDL